MQRLTRLKVEMEMLTKNPPPGIRCWQEESTPADVILSEIKGPEGTAYEGGIFRVDVTLSDRYPFTPPLIDFKTRIYHPNIDQNGRICLSALKPKPSGGTWSVCLNIPTMLSAIRVLLKEPNTSDALMGDIAKEFSEDNKNFMETAREWTLLYATRNQSEVVLN